MLDASTLPPFSSAFVPGSVVAVDISTSASWGEWVEIANGLDQDYGAICGVADSLGIFAVARIYLKNETPEATGVPANTSTGEATTTAADTLTPTAAPVGSSVTT